MTNKMTETEVKLAEALDLVIEGLIREDKEPLYEARYRVLGPLYEKYKESNKAGFKSDND